MRFTEFLVELFTRACLFMLVIFSIAIWLMPAHNVYGTWPSSGEIDLVESRGNRNMVLNGNNIGTQEAGSTLHYGPYPELNGWERAHWIRRNGNGYDREFHRYQLEWTPGNLNVEMSFDHTIFVIGPDRYQQPKQVLDTCLYATNVCG